MFGLIRKKKYNEEINKLKKQISHMKYEWEKEKELYDPTMRQKFLQHKVEIVLVDFDGLELNKHKVIHRPLYNLTEKDAYDIACLVMEEYKYDGLSCLATFHWDNKEECFVIDVKIFSFDCEIKETE